MIDLHTHSTASDGTMSPSALVEYAKTKNITTLALTDHDCIDGIMEAQEKAREIGITLVPELKFQFSGQRENSTCWDWVFIHVHQNFHQLLGI